MRCGGLDQCITTTRSGWARFAAIFVAGMPDVLEARITSGPTMLFVLRVDLLLELELLGDGFDHEFDAVQGLRHRAYVASPSRRRPTASPADRGRPRPGHSRPSLAPAASALVSYSVTCIPARARTAPMPGSHRSGAHHGDATESCSCRFLLLLPGLSCTWMARQTRSGVSGSSVTGTPASATAVAMAADDSGEGPFAAALRTERPGAVGVLDDHAGRFQRAGPPGMGRGTREDCR